ncbi:DNA methyltransferase [Terriglobus sp. TAA 43]|uniref:site-specific DNA-methyltransferase n=1 Tax=Terriglobus sp. TAA 43 TaxID=278961 RepID=UPI00068B677C|nr:DNA methyltransferase [Terriglobus sp. TAA 43]
MNDTDTKSTSRKLALEYRPLASLNFHVNNARTHSRSQIRKIKNSIEEFGFSNPILIQTDGTIIAGHGRVEAAKLLNMTTVPTICLEHLTPDQIRAYVIADNRLAELAGWDNDLLKIELGYLLTLDLSLDVTLTGFEVPEIDLLLEEASSTADEEETIPPTHPVAISRPGDLWMLGHHRIFCGSALEQKSFQTLMDSRRAGMVFVDPPYNVPIDGHASGNGQIEHREFAMASGEMDEHEFTQFLNRSFELLAEHSDCGAVHFLCMDWRHMRELIEAAKPVYDKQLGLCVWAKDVGGMGSLYRSQHELIFVFKTNGGPHRNNIMLGKYGRNRTNVWQYPSASTMSRQGEENLLSLHPTVKPIAMVADAILDCSKRGDIVLDSFLGSGTTLLAAERVGRICYALELDPLYVDVAIRRWQAITGEQAINAVSGRAFEDNIMTEEANEEVIHG